MMHELTFITTNPLPSYWSKDVGVAKPRLARVTYRLVRDENQTGEQPIFMLMREESPVLAYSSEAPSVSDTNKPRAYTVITGIQRLTTRYSVMLPEERAAEDKQAAQQKAAERLYTTPSWNVERDGGNQELAKHNVLLPMMAQIDLVIKIGSLPEELYSFSVLMQARGVLKQETFAAPQQPSPEKATQDKEPETKQIGPSPIAEPGAPKQAQGTSTHREPKPPSSSKVDQAHKKLMSQAHDVRRKGTA
jgi:hypothetical protein